MIFCSCEDFLEEKSQDQIIPDKVQDISELIFGELVYRDIKMLTKFDVMSDDITSRWIQLPYGNSNGFREDLYQYFIWQKDVEYASDGEFVADEAYGKLYADIVLCNSIEDILADLKGTESEKKNALAETYFFRAWSYFDLANIYSTPYVDEATSETALCVPVNNGTGIGAEKFYRSTQREVFNIIERDIENAVKYFEEANTVPTVYRPNYKAACVLATRIYLYEKKYDKVIEYANKIEGINNLYSMKEYVDTYGVIADLKSQDYSRSGHVHFINKNNREIVFSYQDEYETSSLSPTTRTSGMYFPSNDLLSLYEENDLRRKVYFDEEGYITKQAHNARSIYPTNLKLTEALLNRAEAYAYIDATKAKEDLELLRLNRFSSVEEMPEISGDILEAVKLERRRELCFEGIRWMDLRRWGMPQIVHEYYLEDNARKAVYTLQEGDPAYTFRLPESVTILNSEIKQHERPDREPVIVDL